MSRNYPNNLTVEKRRLVYLQQQAHTGGGEYTVILDASLVDAGPDLTCFPFN